MYQTPLAAASIAQVHRARLAATGEEVAVKVLRPGIEKAFRRDIDAFYFAANLIELLSPASRRLRSAASRRPASASARCAACSAASVSSAARRLCA